MIDSQWLNYGKSDGISQQIMLLAGLHVQAGPKFVIGWGLLLYYMIRESCTLCPGVEWGRRLGSVIEHSLAVFHFWVKSISGFPDGAWPQTMFHNRVGSLAGLSAWMRRAKGWTPWPVCRLSSETSHGVIIWAPWWDVAVGYAQQLVRVGLCSLPEQACRMSYVDA